MFPTIRISTQFNIKAKRHLFILYLKKRSVPHVSLCALCGLNSLSNATPKRSAIRATVAKKQAQRPSFVLMCLMWFKFPEQRDPKVQRHPCICGQKTSAASLMCPHVPYVVKFREQREPERSSPPESSDPNLTAPYSLKKLRFSP